MEVKGKGFSKRKEQQREVFKGKQTWHMEGIGLEHNEPWRGRSKGYISHRVLTGYGKGLLFPCYGKPLKGFTQKSDNI